MRRDKLIWWKLILTWLFFLGLHFSYETFPNLLFQIIGEVGETTYFHMKMLFFAYIFSNLIELAVSREKEWPTAQKVYARMFVAVAYPWLTITIFFLSEAITGSMLEMPWEIVYANIVTVIGIYIALRLEEVFEAVELRPALKFSIGFLFLVALFTYIAFSLNTPEYFFQTPPGFTH
jgi:hypothetical protein